MSAPLYNVSVVSVVDNEAIFRVTILDPEEENLPQEANFAVQAVIEAFDLAIHEDFDPEINKIDPALLLQKAEDSPFRKQLERWASYLYGDKREISLEDFRDIEKHFEDERHRFPPNVVSWEESEGSYFLILDPHDPALMEVSDDQILHCVLRDVEMDEEDRPSGELIFTVDDAGILDHLVVGTSWDTDRYDI